MPSHKTRGNICKVIKNKIRCQAKKGGAVLINIPKKFRKKFN